MKNNLLSFFLIILFMTSISTTIPIASASETITVYADRATFVTTQYPNTPIIEPTAIQVGQSNPSYDWKNRAYIHFNSAEMPPTSSIISATLRIRVSSVVMPNGVQTHELHKVNEEWQYTTLTWNNQPSYDSTPFSMWDVTPISAQANHFIEKDVTNLIREQGADSLMIKAQNDGGNLFLYYSYYGMAGTVSTPHLVIIYEPANWRTIHTSSRLEISTNLGDSEVNWIPTYTEAVYNQYVADYGFSIENGGPILMSLERASPGTIVSGVVSERTMELAAGDWAQTRATMHIIAHEMSNIFVGEGVCRGWPSDWWANGHPSPFPMMSAYTVMKELAYHTDAQDLFNEMTGYPVFTRMVWFQQEYGWDMFQTMFATMVEDGIILADISEPVRTHYVVAYASYGAGESLKNHLKTAGVQIDDTIYANVAYSLDKIQELKITTIYNTGHRDNALLFWKSGSYEGAGVAAELAMEPPTTTTTQTATTPSQTTTTSTTSTTTSSTTSTSETTTTSVTTTSTTPSTTVTTSTTTGTSTQPSSSGGLSNGALLILLFSASVIILIILVIILIVKPFNWVRMR